MLVIACGQLACSAGDSRQPTSPTPTFNLVGREWALLELDGQPAGSGAGGAAPTLLLTASDARATGFAGCNRLTGAYQASGNRLSFSRIATTRMFCAGAMDLERRYLAALESTRAYRLTGGYLDLLDDIGVVIARLKAL